MASLLPPLIQELRGDATELLSTYKESAAGAKEMADSTEQSTTKTSAGLTKVKGAANAAGTAVIAGGVALAGLSVAAAAAAQVTDAKLSVAIKNAGGNYAALKPKIEEADAAQRQYGFTNDETNAALASLTTALGSPKKALADLGIAANLAATKNIDLSSAALLVAKTSEGQTKGLKQLGIDLPIAASNAAQVTAAQTKLAAAQAKENSILAATPGAANAASKAHKAYETAVTAVATAQTNLKAKQDAGSIALAALSSKVSGAGKAYGETFAGQLKVASANIEALGEKFGQVLLPAIQKATTIASDFFTFLSKNKPVAIALGVAIGVIATALAAYSIATKIAAAAQLLFNVALDANPIGIIILAIVALIAIIVLLATHWKQVTDFLKTAWKAVSDWFVSVGTSIANWWNGFWKGIGDTAVALFKGYIDIYIDTFKFLYNGVVAIGTDIVNWWNGLWTGIFTWLDNLWKAEVKGWGIIFQTVYTTLVGIGANISTWWNGLWTGIGNFVNSVWKDAGNGIVLFINDVIDSINALVGGINTVLDAVKTASGGTINLHLGKIPHIPSFDVGTSGVPGPVGAPLLAVVHGGEPVLSNAMMNGQASIPQNVVNAVNNQQGGGGGRSNVINATFNTNADPGQIQASLGWLLQRQG